MAREEEKKLTDEEEQLLKEFEEEKQKQKILMENEVHQELKDVLAEQVKDVMEKEVQGGIEEEVKKEVEIAMDIEVEKAIGIEEMKKKIEDEIRKKIEQEIREKLQKEIEEKIRKEVEEREKQRKAELIKKIQALSIYEEELKKQRENEAKEKEELENKIKEKEKLLNESVRLKEETLKEKLKEELKKELEEERQKKREALLQKLEASVRGVDSGRDNIFNKNERIIILQLFEESQLVFFTLLSARLNKKDVESVFIRTLNIASRKHPEVLKKVMYDKNENPLPNGMINISRLISNTELLSDTEENRDSKFMEALNSIFNERIEATEKITSTAIKDKLVSDVYNQMKKNIMKKGYAMKISDAFLKRIFPFEKSSQDKI